MTTMLLDKLDDLLAVHGQESIDPVLLVHPDQQIGLGGSSSVELQLLLQEKDVSHLNLIKADLDVEVGGDALLARGLGVDCEDRHLGAEQLAQSFDKTTLLLILRFPGVFVVHVEHQVRGDAGLDDAGQDETSKEALACARLAEDTVGALDELLEVDTHRGFHLQRLARPGSCCLPQRRRQCQSHSHLQGGRVRSGWARS